MSKLHPELQASLIEYLEGDKVPASWVRKMLELEERSPRKLFRFALVSRRTKIGDVHIFTKPLMSASASPEAAAYAGCSHAHDTCSLLGRKCLAIVKLERPVVSMSLKTIRKNIEGARRHGTALKRLEREQEWLIKGPVSGVVVYLTDDTTIIGSGKYRRYAR